MINRREIEKLLFKIQTFDEGIKKCKAMFQACPSKELEEELLIMLAKYTKLKNELFYIKQTIPPPTQDRKELTMLEKKYGLAF